MCHVCNVCRYIAAVELLGERDESLEELRADLHEVKHMYKDQIEFMCMQLTVLQASSVLPPRLSGEHGHGLHGHLHQVPLVVQPGSAQLHVASGADCTAQLNAL